MGEARVPVLLVPGTGGFAFPYWTVMTQRLVDDDFHVYAKNLSWGNLGDVRRSAAKVAKKVEFVLEESGAEKLDVIGHSLGGILLRYYVERLGGHKVVRNLITLGTPHHGTLATALLWPFSAMRQIFYRSPFLEKLNRDRRENGVRYTSIYGLLDPACLPIWSCHLEGADNRLMVACEHLGLLVHPGVYLWVREALRPRTRPLVSAATRQHHP